MFPSSTVIMLNLMFGSSRLPPVKLERSVGFFSTRGKLMRQVRRTGPLGPSCPGLRRPRAERWR
eukprot:3551634-Pyramimonas_sp.AAC.1